jgi:hypothetical protein
MAMVAAIGLYLQRSSPLLRHAEKMCTHHARHITQGTPINFDRYPLRELGSPTMEHTIAEYRREFENNGVIVLPEFIHKHAICSMVTEVEAAASDAYVCSREHPVYLGSSKELQESNSVHTTVGIFDPPCTCISDLSARQGDVRQSSHSR